MFVFIIIVAYILVVILINYKIIPREEHWADTGLRALAQARAQIYISEYILV